MSDATTVVATLKEGIQQFSAVRGWEPYHTPKNLVMALASEVGELCDLYRWLTPEESLSVGQDASVREAIADELADIANIIFLLSVHTGIELSDAIQKKMTKNAVKYPVPS